MSQSDRFVLHLRRWQGGQPGTPVALPQTQARTNDPAMVWTDSDEVVTVVFEWWGQSQENCKGVNRLTISLPDFNRAFGPEENEILPDARPHEEDLLVCYRSPGVRVEPERWGSRLKVQAEDGLAPGSLVVLAGEADDPSMGSHSGLPSHCSCCCSSWPPSSCATGSHSGTGCGKLPSRSRSTCLDGTLEWTAGQPERFVVSLDAQGQPNGELSRRQPGPDEHAVVVAPESKNTFRLSVAAGPQWTMQRFDRDKESQAPRPLTRTGETVELVDLTQGLACV